MNEARYGALGVAITRLSRAIGDGAPTDDCNLAIRAVNSLLSERSSSLRNEFVLDVAGYVVGTALIGAPEDFKRITPQASQYAELILAIRNPGCVRGTEIVEVFKNRWGHNRGFGPIVMVAAMCRVTLTPKL